MTFVSERKDRMKEAAAEAERIIMDERAMRQAKYDAAKSEVCTRRRRGIGWRGVASERWVSV